MNFDELAEYVQRRLLESKVIPEWATSPWCVDGVAAPIIHNTLRQTMSGDKWAWEYCDAKIAEATKFPPDPAEPKHFSLLLWTRTPREPPPKYSAPLAFVFSLKNLIKRNC